MFDIAWSELLLIAVVALIFIGPKELPAVLANLGRMTAKLRRSADEFRRHFEELMRDSGYEDLHKNIQDFRALNPANQLKASIDRAINQELFVETRVAAGPARTSNSRAWHRTCRRHSCPNAAGIGGRASKASGRDRKRSRRAGSLS